MADKIKSSKVALYLNTCFCLSKLSLTPKSAIDESGTVVSHTSSSIYASDFFRVRNGATIMICGNTSSVGTQSSTYMAFYNKNKELVFAYKLGTASSLVQKTDDYTLVYRLDSQLENADEIEFCRVTVWANGTDVSLKVTDWNRMGKGIVSLPISYGAKTTSETYVDEENASTTVDGYEIATDVEQTAIKGDPVFDYVDIIRKELLTGSDCETQALVIPIYDLTKTESGYTGTAQRFGATVTITDFELNGGEIVKIKYKVSFNGNPENVNIELADGVILPSLTLGTLEGGEDEENELFPTEPEE
ncbi:MAG: hypothetical protein J6L62_02780 [Clostridia bacterium]|nr:hypothetical protein [Clostridia bacterium]